MAATGAALAAVFAFTMMKPKPQSEAAINETYLD